jgi:nickel transport protein
MLFRQEIAMRNKTTVVKCGALLFVVTGVATMTAGSAVAHDIWMTTSRADGQQTAEIVFGDLVGLELADLKKIVSFELVSPAGTIDLQKSLTEATSSGHPVLKSKPFSATSNAILAVTYDNGFWTRRPGDKRPGDEAWTNTNKLMMPSAAESTWSVKWGKTLLGPGSYAVVLHTRLEIVVLRDPYSTPVGSKLPVRLELDGKPVAGAAIAHTDGLEKLPDSQQPKVRTGENGVAEIPIGRKGPYLLTVDVETASLSGKLAEKDNLYASLSFDTLK